MKTLRDIIPIDEGKLKKVLKNIKAKLKGEYAKEKEVFDNTLGEEDIEEKRGTSSGQGILNRNFGAMKNIDLNKMVMDTLKRKVKDRGEAIAALHTLPIPQQNALDKNHYRLGEMRYDPFNWGLKKLDKKDKKSDPSHVETPKNSVREYLKYLVSKDND